MESLDQILNNPEALADFNSLPRNERAIAIGKLDPDFKQMKLKDRFDVLDRIEGHAPKPQGFTQELGHALNPMRTVPNFIQGVRGGLAGTGVGIEKAITTPGSFKERAEQAILSAAPATKPGYKPQEGEKLGYYAGKYSPEILGTAMGAGEALVSGAKTLGQGSVEAGYEGLDALLARKGVNPGISEIEENTPKAIAEYSKTTAKTLENFKDDPSKLERVREDITRIFNNKWESTKTGVGRELAQTKERATKMLVDKVPEIGDALDKIKGAYDKEKLIDAITRASKVLGTATLGGLGLKGGLTLGQKVIGAVSNGQ